MSTGYINGLNVLTPKPDGMESFELTPEATPEELEIIFSDVKQTTEKPRIIESINLDESSPKILGNDHANDSSCIVMEHASVENDDTVAEKSLITLSDSRDEIECLEISEINSNEVEVTQMQVSDAAKTTDLTESTFGLVPRDSRIDAPSAAPETDEYRLSSSVTCSINSKNRLPPSKKDTAAKAEIINTVSSLSCLAAEYASSDEESDEEIRAPSPCELITIVDDADYKTQSKTEYRTKPTIDVSDGEDTDSDSDSSEESDSSDSDSSEGEAEDGHENVRKVQPSKTKKTKSEFEDLPPIEELKITVPEELCDRLGEVSGIVEQLVIVRPISGKPTLNLDSILFLEKGHRVLGQVFDVFGQVSDPNYCVRFNSEEHIKTSGIVLGMEVYYSPTTPEHTSLVFLHELVKLKGIDVSGEDDIEPPEFSDDEEERAYNQMQRQKQRQKPGNERQAYSESEGIPQKRQCYDRQRNPWSGDWQSYNYNNPRPNRNYGQGPPKWNPENSQPPIQNPFNTQNPANQAPPNQYGQSNNFNDSQYQYNPYNSPYQQFPPPNSGYAFGRPPGFRPNFNNYGPNLYRPSPYPPPPMSWAPPPPPPPPPSSM